MKRFSKILSFLMLLFLLTAETCSDSSTEVTREEKQSEMFQNIEDEFLNDELTLELLRAFEKRAIQKLGDLDDYLNIYAQPNFDKEFRIQAVQMVRELFYSESDIPNFYKELELVEDTAARILYSSKNGGTFKTEINSIKVTRNFQKQSVSNYAGELRFT
ncbi:MAG: hypothetical protein HQ522_04085, partial [Bacteroidetes bacterium]|nr:hypothetical protein [Bacteroidota bacterium]